ELSLFQQTDILCGALGLTYGVDYGEGFYSSANAAVLYHTMKAAPDARSLAELSERMAYEPAHAKPRELNPDVRNARIHVQDVLKRLASFEALNVPPGDRAAIDLGRVFVEPELHYFHLAGVLGPGSSPEIARLVTYSLLCAAAMCPARRQVYLVIDE